MNVSTAANRFDAEHDLIATLVRVVPVRVVEVSRSGCRMESTARLEPGLSGKLTLELGGLARVDDVRVTRCQQRPGGNCGVSGRS